MEKLFTYKLTNSTFTFTEGMGYKKISVVNRSDSTADGTLLGTGVAGFTSTAVDIEAGQPATIINNANSYESVVITAPSGCTLNIIASKN